MQRVQKLAIKLIVGCCFLYANNGNAQEDRDKYYFLDKIIQLTKKSGDSVYHLSRRNGIGRGALINYYEFRFNNRSFYTTFTYDSITDKIGYDTLQLEQNLIKWKAKYRVLDNVFSREDLERIIQNNREDTLWDITNLFSNRKNNLPINWSNSYYCKNAISKPYYNGKKDYTLIVYVEKGVNSIFFVFKKDEEDWKLIERVENVGW